MRLIQRTEIQKPKEVFNLHIQNDHNYIVNDAVVKNCHTSQAQQLKDLLTGPFAHVPLRFGMTGTIPKEEYNATSLVVSIGEIAGKVSAKELQDKGVLSSCNIEIMQLQDKKYDMNSYDEEMEFLSYNEERLKNVAYIAEQISQTGNTLILINRVETGNILQKYIPDSSFVSGTTKGKDRKKEYKEINDVDNKVLIATMGVASTGINIPRLFNIILLDSGKSFVRVIQSIGRGLRKANDKDSVNIYDVCSNMKYSKKHLTERKKYYKEAEYPFNMSKVDLL